MNSFQISAIIINLDKSKDRWNFQKKQLQRLNISFERLGAYSLDMLSDETYTKWANDWQRKLKPAEVACFLSHYSIWKRISTSAKAYLVLEDDAILSHHLPDFLNALSTIENIDYDHISLETRNRKKLVSQKGIHIIDNIYLNQLHLDKTGAAAYILTPNGAQKLLRAVDKTGAGLADALLCHTKQLNSLQTVPALSIQMDMAEYYGMSNNLFTEFGTSNISSADNKKINHSRFFKKIIFKKRRLITQINIGFIKLAKFRKSDYININFKL